MKISDLITLDDDREYLLAEEYEYEDNKYFLAVGIKDNNLNKEDFKFFLHSVENGEDYVEEVEDENTLKVLTSLLGIDVALEADPKNEEELDKFFDKLKEEGSF